MKTVLFFQHANKNYGPLVRQESCPFFSVHFEMNPILNRMEHFEVTPIINYNKSTKGFLDEAKVS